jgi:hypothetical protein
MDSKNVQLDQLFDDFPEPLPPSPEKLEISQERLIGNLWNFNMMFPKIWPLICAKSQFLTFHSALYYWSFEIFFWFSRKIQDGHQFQNTPKWFKIEWDFQSVIEIHIAKNCGWYCEISEIVNKNTERASWGSDMVLPYI